MLAPSRSYAPTSTIRIFPSGVTSRPVTTSTHRLCGAVAGVTRLLSEAGLFTDRDLVDGRAQRRAGSGSAELSCQTPCRFLLAAAFQEADGLHSHMPNTMKFVF